MSCGPLQYIRATRHAITHFASIHHSKGRRTRWEIPGVYLSWPGSHLYLLWQSASAPKHEDHPHCCWTPATTDCHLQCSMEMH